MSIIFVSKFFNMKKQVLILSLLFSVTAHSQSYIDTVGLSGLWSFSGNANDSSGNGNNGIVYGATLCTDRFGNANSAYHFNGSSNYITSPASFIIGSGDKSYSVWFKSDTIKRGWILEGGIDNIGQAFGLFVQDNSGTIVFQGMNTPYDIIIDTLTDTTQWHNVVITYSSDTLKSYMDGKFKYSRYDNLNTANAGIIFGRRQNPAIEGGTDAYFKGKIDDIAIWNHSLSTCEIAKLNIASNTLIIKQPINDTVLTGNTAIYSIIDTGGSATYQWQENNGSGFVNLSNVTPYAGVTSKTLTINPISLSMNNYHYRCIRNSVCIDTSNAAKLTVNARTGIEVTEVKNNITIAPNPTQNVITITSSIQIEKVEVMNLLGQVVLLEKTNCNSISVDLSNFNNGIYLLRINSNIINKVIKN